MHPFVALMKKYCIDYTNSHDQSLYDELMEPDYVVHISGMDLIRSSSYSNEVTSLFKSSPGLGLVVHEFVLNGNRLCMHFSEHGSFPDGDGRVLACWRGIGLYKWNGQRLTENFVEQDYFALKRQRTTRQPDPLNSPHLDPWMMTQPVPANQAAEAVVRNWLSKGDLMDVEELEIDDSRLGGPSEPVLDVEAVEVNDIFSAGSTVPFHVSLSGRYVGGLGDAFEARVGEPASMYAAGIAKVEGDRVARVDAVRTRATTAAALRS